MLQLSDHHDAYTVNFKVYFFTIIDIAHFSFMTRNTQVDDQLSAAGRSAPKGENSELQAFFEKKHIRLRLRDRLR
ncbi:MAG: hypothetical protein JWM58_136 [Rhizobium sp.]|nr:hypothetical protein [Rhizobium sp.]